MSDPTQLPEGFEIDTAPPEGFELDTPAAPEWAGEMPPWLKSAVKSGRAKRVSSAPMEGPEGFATQDIFEVQTPQGPGRVNTRGDYLPSDDEMAVWRKASEARTKLGGLKETGRLGLQDAVAALDAGSFSASPNLAGLHALTMWPVDPKTGAKSPHSNPMEAYRAARDAMDATRDEAKRKAGVLPQVVGMLPGSLVGAPATALGRIGYGGALAGIQAAGESEADVTKGEVGPFLKDVGAGAGIGAATAGLAEGVTAPLRLLGGKATQAAGKAEAKQLAEEIATRTANAASKRGSAGAETRKVLLTIQEATEALSDPRASSAVKAAAQELLDSPAAQKAVEAARLNKFQAFMSDAGNAQALRDLASQEATNIGGRAAEATAEKIAPGAVASEMGGKFMKSVGQRLALSGVGGAAGAGIAAATGHDKGAGAGIGAGAGFAAPAGLVQFIRNSAGNPRLQKVLADAAAKVLGTGANATSGAAGLGARTALQASTGDLPPEEKRRLQMAALLKAIGGDDEEMTP